MTKKFISYGRQSITESDINSVIEVLKSDYLTQGPKIPEFEKAICDYTGSKYCVAVTNATAALHIAVAALNIPDGHEGITTPNTFLATSNCLLYNKLNPVFVDIDSDSLNISIDQIKKKINDKTGVVIPVHFAGLPVDMKRLNDVVNDKNIKIIEDASHAIGGTYSDGSKIGCCKYSDMTVFSFHPVKTITTGEGGVITTNNLDLYNKLIALRCHGMVRDNNLFENESPGPWYYEMQDLGFNYRLTDIQAALGINQIKKIDEIATRRTEIILKYNESFKNYDWLITPSQPEHKVCFHLYVLQIDFEKISKSRTEVIQILKDQYIGTQVHYIPIYRQPFYQKLLKSKDYSDYENCEKYYTQALSIPLFPTMNDVEVEHVINCVLNLEIS